MTELVSNKLLLYSRETHRERSARKRAGRIAAGRWPVPVAELAVSWYSLKVTITGDGRPRFGETLRELTQARVPWLALATARSACHCGRSHAMGGVTLVDATDPHVPPVTVNPFEPEPGYPVQIHADRLAGLLEAAFGLPVPVAAAIRAGLWRAYADCGWDMLTGAAPPGVRTAPAVPAFGRLAQASLAAAQDLGYDRVMEAEVRGFVHTRLEPLWTGPAGRLLEGGHPADVGSLIQGRVLILVGDAADDGTAFLTGALLARICERLRADARRDPDRAGCPGRGNHRAPGREVRPGPRLAVVTAADLAPGAAGRPGAAAWFGRLHDDLRAVGAEVIVAGAARVSETAPEPEPEPEPEPGSELGPGSGAAVGPAATPVLRGRRSAACGVRCRGQGPCSGYELHAAGLLSRAEEQAWLRIWAHTLLLAFLAGRPLPGLPGEVLSRWRALPPRQRECVLASILDRAVTARAAALRPYYDPGGLMSVMAATAARILAQTAVPFRAGPVWVIPQLRWLHETERLHPLGGTGIRPDDIAPPLDFGLAGLPDWPGIRIRDRLTALGRHPLSMALPRNRRLAATALLGEDGRGSLDADLAAAAVGIHPAGRLAYAARLMGTGAPGPEPGWLEVVLSWPDRIIGSAWDTDLRPIATG
jgi:uncharacterized protein